MKFSRLLLLVGIAFFAFARPAKSAESLDQTINYLIDYVTKAKATFVRNGTAHTPAEAADHIKAKYAHFKKDIKTPEDFIRLSASTSILTGKPYLVRLPDGKEMNLDAWLADALKQHQSESHS
jgi:hypothetical protein